MQISETRAPRSSALCTAIDAAHDLRRSCHALRARARRRARARQVARESCRTGRGRTGGAPGSWPITSPIDLRPFVHSERSTLIRPSARRRAESASASRRRVRAHAPRGEVVELERMDRDDVDLDANRLDRGRRPHLIDADVSRRLKCCALSAIRGRAADGGRCGRGMHASQLKSVCDSERHSHATETGA